MSTTSVDNVAIDQDLANELLGHDALQNLLPKDWVDAKAARQNAFDDALKRLRKQSPPVLESQLADMTELRDLVVYGALAKLYQHNMTTGGTDDINARNYKIFDGKFLTELRDLNPTVTGSLRAASGTISFHRR